MDSSRQGDADDGRARWLCLVGGRFRGVRAAAVVLALTAVGLMIVAIAGMVTGRPSQRAGVIVRVAALLAFVGAVALNVAAH